MRATWAVVVAGVLGVVPATADDKATCAAAYKSAQDLQEKSSLLEAREQLKICARPTCAEFVVKDCTVWLEAVQKKIPSVIFVAEPAKGDKLADVSVRVGQKVFAATLDGKPVEIDPGRYEFVFATKDGRTVVVESVVVQSQKDVVVRAVLPALPATTVTTEKDKDPIVVTPPPAVDEGSGRRTAGFVVGGVGLVGIGLGTIFAIDGKNKYDQGDYDARKKFQLGVGVGVVGALALVGGAVLVLTAPSRTASVALGPDGVRFAIRF